MNILRESQIAILKRKLRVAYTEYMTLDTNGAGNELFDNITGGRLTAARNKCNTILAELRTGIPARTHRYRKRRDGLYASRKL